MTPWKRRDGDGANGRPSTTPSPLRIFELPAIARRRETGVTRHPTRRPLPRDDPRRPDDFPAHLTLPTPRRVAELRIRLARLPHEVLRRPERFLGSRQGSDAQRRRCHPVSLARRGRRRQSGVERNGLGGYGRSPAGYDETGNLKQVRVVRVVRSGACTNNTTTCNLRFYDYFDEADCNALLAVSTSGRTRGTSSSRLTFSRRLVRTKWRDTSRKLTSSREPLILRRGSPNDSRCSQTLRHAAKRSGRCS
jgi:hypothetical protein